MTPAGALPRRRAGDCAAGVRVPMFGAASRSRSVAIVTVQHASRTGGGVPVVHEPAVLAAPG
jgi:hypothetical protein